MRARQILFNHWKPDQERRGFVVGTRGESGRFDVQRTVEPTRFPVGSCKCGGSVAEIAGDTCLKFFICTKCCASRAA